RERQAFGAEAVTERQSGAAGHRSERGKLGLFPFVVEADRAACVEARRRTGRGGEKVIVRSIERFDFANETSPLTLRLHVIHRLESAEREDAAAHDFAELVRALDEELLMHAEELSFGDEILDVGVLLER